MIPFDDLVAAARKVVPNERLHSDPRERDGFYALVGVDLARSLVWAIEVWAEVQNPIVLMQWRIEREVVRYREHATKAYGNTPPMSVAVKLQEMNRFAAALRLLLIERFDILSQDVEESFAAAVKAAIQ